MTTAHKFCLPSLQEQLDLITQKTRALVQADRLATSERAAGDLLASGIEQCMLRAGALAPEFTLVDSLTSKPVRSKDLLALGPLVIKFFRGRWCPYCSTELENWRDLHIELRRMGAFFVGISPQTRRQNDLLIQQHRIPFPILVDSGAELARQFGIAYTVSEPLRAHYQGILVNLPLVNSGAAYKDATEASWRLPLPAIFIVRQNGTIAFSEGHADFRVRPEPSEILSVLNSL